MNWTAILVPPAFVAILTIVAAIVWRKAKTKKVLLDPDKAALPFVTAISVLAIGIPLVAAFLQEVLKSAANRWVADLLLAAMMLAVLSLFVGAYVVYTILLDAPKDPTTQKMILGEGRFGLPAAMACQYASLVAFLGCTVVALAAYAIQARGAAPSAPSGIGSVLIERPLPELAMSRDAVYRLWGEPNTATDNRLEYNAHAAVVVFCLRENKITKIIHSERSEDHGQKNSC
jgi:hypothetical protein